MLALTLPVVSAISALPPCMVHVTANNWHQATRQATHYAQRVERIPAPVVPFASEHDFAVAYRRRILAEHTIQMPDLNGHQEQWWRNSGTLVAMSTIRELD